MLNFLLTTLMLFSSQITYARTLVITDSHGEGTFGGSLVKMLEKQNHEVSFYAVGGSTPTDWVLGKQQIWGMWEYHTGKLDKRTKKPVTPKLEDLIKKLQPDNVVIELGTNLIWRDINAQDRNHTFELMKIVYESGAKCFWVGPPGLRPEKKFQQENIRVVHTMLEEIVPDNNCKLIRSWQVIHYPLKGGDGIHYDSVATGANLAHDWAKLVNYQIYLELK